MNGWSTLEWIAAISGIAAIIGTGFAAWSFFRQSKNDMTKASSSGDNSPVAKVANSPNSTVVMNSPSAVVVRGDVHVTSSFAADEHERITEVRADMERAHQAEVAALRGQIDALTHPEWNRDVLNAVDDALNANQYDRAEKLMAEMEQDHLAAASISSATKQVRIRQWRAVIALLNDDAKTARKHIEVAVGILTPFGLLNALEFRNDAAKNFQDFGQRVGGDGIVEAIKLYRLNLAQLNRDTDPWEETQFNLGNALLMHGMRTEEGLQLFTEAICAFRAALQVCTRATDPNNWAETQISLGGALLALGRQRGGAVGATCLAEAVDVLRSAAEVRTRQVDPESWARIQHNLGAALSQQGTWRGGEDGALLLGEAVNVYRGLLEVCTRESDALGWAGSKENLASSLAEQGTLMPDDSAVGILHEAVESARAALQVYKREKHPLEWASAHGNIGAILNELAHRHEGEAGLKYVQAAGAALQNAMHVYTREELPVQWAGIQRNLCAVFLREAELKDRHGGPSATSMAISACRAALEVYTRTEDPLSWAATQFNLGAALLYRAGWAVAPQECLADLKEAASAFGSAQNVYVRKAHPTRWADVHRCLGHVYESMGHFDTRHAKDHYRRALHEISQALGVPPTEQRRDRFEDARSTREQLIAKLSEFDH